VRISILIQKWPHCCLCYIVPGHHLCFLYLRDTAEKVAIYSSSVVRSRFAIVRRLSVGEGGAEAAGENTPSPESFSCTSSEAKNV
jgi:hypothetical protein